MDYSQSYHRRNEHLEKMEPPTISDVKEALGIDLAEIFFESCPEVFKCDLSTDVKLKGPGEDLWVSPSDLLIQKVVLKPPLTNRYMKALTHEAILEIGESIEKKFMNEMELDKQKDLCEQEAVLTFMAQKDKAKAMEEALAREQEMYKLRTEDIEKEFQILLKTELENLENSLKEVYDQVLQEKTLAMLEDQEQFWISKVKSAVDEAVELIVKQCEEDKEEQEAQLTGIFQMKLEGQEEKYMELLKNEQQVFQILLKQLKHNLECSNMSNLMYTLCVERKKCNEDKQDLVVNYENKISKLKEFIRDQEEAINTLIREKEYKQYQCDIREKSLFNVICQFQKFINFALKAYPTQAEFLLNVKEMMTFELVQAIASTAKDEEKKHYMKQIMPWRTSSEKKVKEDDITAKDYHACLNEIRKPRIISESKESLPAFKYQDHLYVREDFRNAISQGFDVRKSSSIWNMDHENLVQLLQPAPPVETEKESPDNSVRLERSHISNVKFDNIRLPSYSEIVGLLGAQDSVILQKSTKSHLSYRDPSINAAAGPVNLLGAQDSLVVIKHTLSTGESPIQKEISGREDIHQTSTTLQLQKSNEPVFATVSADTLQIHKEKPPSKTPSIEVQKQKLESKETLQFLKKIVEKKESIDKSLKSTESKAHKSHRVASLSLHRDSIDILKNVPSRKQIKGIKELLSLPESEKRNKLITNLVINIPPCEVGKAVDVSFSHVAKFYSELAEMKEIPPKIYSQTPEPPKPVKRENFLKKPNAAKVIGRPGIEHLETSKDFTIHRIHSLMDILKKDDSLIRIFTGCSQ